MPPAQQIRTYENGRLVWYRQAANAAYWDRHWRLQATRDAYRAAERGRLGVLERPIHRWLPPEGRVLEAGCGLAHHVVALRQRGWDAEGVDFAMETIDAVRAIWPDLPVQVGDVTRLDVPANTYSGYISLGVMEHCLDGPTTFLSEAWRVLRPGGLAFISVPHLHPLRKLKVHWGCFPRNPQCPEPPEPAVTEEPSQVLQFYQYAFTVPEFCALVQNAGFRVLDVSCYDGLKGIADEIYGARLVLKVLQRIPLAGGLLRHWLRSCRLGHMLLVVCQKADAGARRAA